MNFSSKRYFTEEKARRIPAPDSRNLVKKVDWFKRYCKFRYMCLRTLLILLILNCNTSIKKSFLEWTNAYAIFRLSSSITCSQTSTFTVSPPVIANLINNSIFQTGFLIGTASGTVTSIEVSFDNGTYSTAVGLPPGKWLSLHTDIINNCVFSYWLP